MSTAYWEMNTDINKVFELILTTAVTNKVKQQDMPTHIIIISDMQFDGCTNKTNFNQIKEMYENTQYTMPQLIFWNVAYKGTQPVKANKENASLISGFSPSIMKSILTQTNTTPYEQMLETIMNKRYDF